MCRQQLGAQLVHEGRLHHAAGAKAAQCVVGQPGQLRMLQRPDAERQPEALLLLGQDVVGQEAAQRFLEEPAQLLALQLVVVGQLQRKVQHLVGQQRKGGGDAGQCGGADDLGQVVVGQGVFPVVGQHAVDLARAGAAGVHRAVGLLVVTRVHLGEKGGGEHLGQAQAGQQVVHVQPVRHGHAGLLHIAGSLAQAGQALGDTVVQQGLHHQAAQWRGNVLVQTEQPLLGVARVSAEEFVTAVTGQQRRAAVLARHAGTVVSRHGR